jgi:hypothetical protein
MVGPLGAVSVKNILFNKTGRFTGGPPFPFMAGSVAKVPKGAAADFRQRTKQVIVADQ